jgi:hypothetical protein
MPVKPGMSRDDGSLAYAYCLFPVASAVPYRLSPVPLLPIPISEDQSDQCHQW